MIKLEKVNKYFNYKKKNEIHVINNTSLELPDHGLVALLGPSGCGKTTLLNAIGGLDKVKNGKIYINDKQLNKKSSYKVDKIRNLNVGYIFQNYYLIDNKTVFDNVAISLKMLGIKDKNEIKERVNYVLDILGIYRYRNRPASMLSGGERQRVGIARAIVKNPNIILADEPTGNLDSSNTIEIMNIIKSISKNRLVILVTHENDIAKFYADRILEIEDGVIQKDYINKHNNDLDYRIDNKIYLKDFENFNKLSKNQNNIEIYSDNDKKLDITIVVKNNNIYIKADKSKVEVIDNDSNIELINDHYKKIDKSVYEKYEFDFSKVNNKKKLKYSSIINPINMIINGFRKVLDYSFIKKILLLGFLASGAFITYCVCNVFGITNIKDSYFITTNRNYYVTKMPSVTLEKYKKAEKLENVDYLLPGDSQVTFNIVYPYYYQTKEAFSQLKGSLVDSKLLKSSDIILGRLPENKNEVVIDIMTVERMFKNDTTCMLVGISSYEDLLNHPIIIPNLPEFTIVGFTNNEDPSIYADSSMLINIINNSMDDGWYQDVSFSERLLDYEMLDNLTIKKGTLPKNDYEVMLNYNLMYDYDLNKKIDFKVNGKKLTVVGFYESNDIEAYITNNNTVKYGLITSKSNITAMPKDKNNIVSDFNNIGLNSESVYQKELNSYKEEKKDAINAGLIASSIILFISFMEIYLMVRSSFLSRVKEVGIYRAIGVKKSDIYKMFFGEIFAITTLACVSGSIIVMYCLKLMQVVSYFEQNYMVNLFTFIVSIIIIYIFNLIVGLWPVKRIIRKTPAQILSRKDLD